MYPAQQTALPSPDKQLYCCGLLRCSLWLNGGPGCSSFDGFIYEQGPFLHSIKGGNVSLVDNPFAWNKVATMIFLDSPSGECSEGLPLIGLGLCDISHWFEALP